MQTPAGRRVSPGSRKREEPQLSVSRRLRPLCLRAPRPQCNPPLANLPAPTRVPASEFGEGAPLNLPVEPSSEDLQGEGDPWPRLGLPVGPSSEDLQGEGDPWPVGLPVESSSEDLQGEGDPWPRMGLPVPTRIMEKLKIGPNELLATNKKLIYARLTGYGQNGSFANMAGHDINYLGLSGLLSLFGRYNEKPIPPINLAADFGGGGLICALGITLALYERTKSNVGQVIDASMVEGSAYLGSWLFRSQKMGIWENPRGRNLLDTGSHFYDTYETKDKLFMCVGAIEPQFYEIFLEKLGLSSDEIPQYKNFEENRRKITEIFKTKTQAEWCAIFDSTDACVTPVLNLKDVMLHIHNKQRQTFTIVGDNLFPNPAPRLSRTPGISLGVQRNPQAGEDTVQILTELKFQPNEIDHLLSNGIAYQSRHISKL
ncbi:Alpha-methylacyl-CoA racemase [Trachymyrmex cornetzi]|uniref:Alpha-methylacyl-CoA racemase n=2 Tax=Trachymyrmex cornetzi TaxID=471704 RepID=A0A151IZ55_9HYME|nr:Alpha-methylacyl-CoA racemase [Trachymyrmex cornetzi]